jgi:hypothetical protein
MELKKKKLWLGLILIWFGLILVFLRVECFAQQTIAPFKTQQANTVFYVNMGNTTLTTIQKTVTAACAYSTATVVDILPGSNPSDTIGGLTSACTNTRIFDQRVSPADNYSCTSGGCTLVPYATTAPVFPALVALPTPASTTYLQAQNNAKNVPVHIAVLGDSFTVACQPLSSPGTGPVSCANRWPEQIRMQLQAIYGSHGTGVYPVIVATGAVINNQAWSCSGSFSTSNILGPTQSGSGAGNTLVALGPSASCTFHDNRNIAWDTLNTYCGTNSTSVGIAVNIDSGAFTGTACGSTTGSATAHIVTLAAAASTSHSVTFTNTAGSGTAYLYAAEGQSGTTGVSVDNMGLGGATSNAFGSAVTTELAFSDLIPGGAQAALFMDQTNDASLGVATATFSTNVQNFITHEQGLASAPTVMLTIPPVDIINNTSPMGPYTTIQVGLCSSNSLTCIDIQNRGTTVGSTVVGWGTSFPGCPNILWDCTGSSAGIHPNDAGNLDEFQLIYAALVNPTSGGTSVPSTNNLLNAPGGTLAAIPGIAPVVVATGGAFNGLGIASAPGGFSNLTTYIGNVLGLQGVNSTNTIFDGTNWRYTVNGIAVAFRTENSSGSDSAFHVAVCPAGTAGAILLMDTTCTAQYTRSSGSGNQTWFNSQLGNPSFPANAAVVANPSANWMVDFSGNETANSVTAPTGAFSSELDVKSGASTGLFQTPTLVLGENGSQIAYSLAPQTGVAAYGLGAGGQFSITPNGTIAGANAGTPQWSISNLTGAAAFLSTSIQATTVTGDVITTDNTTGHIHDSGIPSSTLASTGLSNSWAASQDFTTIAVTNSINNEPGMQIVSVAGCAITAGVIGTFCVTTITMSTPEPDTGYEVSGCSFTEGVGTTGPLTMGSVFNKTTTTFELSLVAPTVGSANTASTGAIICMVTHP